MPRCLLSTSIIGRMDQCHGRRQVVRWPKGKGSPTTMGFGRRSLSITRRPEPGWKISITTSQQWMPLASRREKGEKIARISHARLASHSSHLTTATHSGMREKFTPGNREAQRRDGDASGPSHSGISRTAEKRNLRLAVTSSRLAPQLLKPRSATTSQVPRHWPSTSPSRRPSITPVRLPLVLSIRAVTAASKLRSSPVLLWCA